MAEPIGEFLLLRRLREANQSYRDELALLTGRHALLLSAARRAIQPNADLDDLRLAIELDGHHPSVTEPRR